MQFDMLPDTAIMEEYLAVCFHFIEEFNCTEAMDSEGDFVIEEKFFFNKTSVMVLKDQEFFWNKMIEAHQAFQI